ncbi:MAG: methyltransferase [Clostridiales bacterium]|nr:methyltransferase [Clostridiales bacterium]
MSYTKEDLGRAGFVLYQNEDGFRFGTDSVLLAWFASSFVRKGRKAAPGFLEFGSGCGPVSMLVAARVPDSRIDAVEIKPGACEALRKNISENGLEGRVRAFNADIRELPSEIRGKQYDVVMFNPPFFSGSKGPKCKRTGCDSERLSGRFEENGTMDDFLKAAASRVVQSSGHIVMIMHGLRLPDTLRAFDDNKIKPVALLNIHPLADRAASSFLIAGKKGGSGTDMKILPPLILSKRSSNGDGIINTENIIRIYEEEHTDCFI